MTAQDLENMSDRDLTEAELQPLEVEYDMEKSKELKTKANELFKGALAATQITEEMKVQGIELDETEKTDEVIDTYKEAIHVCPPDESEHLAILHNNLGIVYLKMGK